jgi:hypothetical protein
MQTTNVKPTYSSNELPRVRTRIRHDFVPTLPTKCPSHRRVSDGSRIRKSLPVIELQEQFQYYQGMGAWRG